MDLGLNSIMKCNSGDVANPSTSITMIDNLTLNYVAMHNRTIISKTN